MSPSSDASPALASAFPETSAFAQTPAVPETSAFPERGPGGGRRTRDLRRQPRWSEAPVVHSRVDAGVAGIRAMCPLTSTLLHFEGRLSLEVAGFLYGAQRPAPLWDFAHAFLIGLLGDEDPLVRNVSRFELVSTGGVVDSAEPWVWDRDPLCVVADLLCGDDPRRLPRSTHPIILDLASDGWLTFTGRLS